MFQTGKFVEGIGYRLFGSAGGANGDKNQIVQMLVTADATAHLGLKG